MPTGYTYKLLKGKGQTFPEFAKTCARAFGAFVHMRDDSMDKPLPKTVKVDKYHEKSLKKANARLVKLQAMSPAQKTIYGAKLLERDIKHCISARNKVLKENGILQQMAEKVRNWTPPTSEHINLKEFMLQQLNTSETGTGYYDELLEKLQAMGPADAYKKDLENTLWEVNYHMEKMGEEKKRIEGANLWIKNLFESLERYERTR